jgi:3-methyladenine DNA glycosylase AlkD
LWKAEAFRYIADVDQVKRLSTDIRDALNAAADGRAPARDTTFNKPGDEWVALGLRAPVYYGVMKGFRSRVLALSLEERLRLAGELLATHIGEYGHAGMHVLGLSAKELSPSHFPALDRMLDDFRGWSHVDDFCIGVAQPLLAAYPRETVALLDGWTRSPDQWKRRSSVVAFVRKVGESGAFTDTVLGFCERLAWDPEDLVRKGVGWALKDNMRGAKARVIEYVKSLRARGAPGVVTLYAVRDLKGAERAEVLAVKPGR